ncbi:MAG: hypothetical protein JWL63_900 [Rhodocyclales bacterium]|nr:hypothetical protein [Rhodocyclales bacterium]
MNTFSKSQTAALHPVLDHKPALRAVADSNGVICLDETWRSWSHKYNFVCAEGHAFSLSARRFGEARVPCSTCRQIARAQRDTQAFDRLRQIATDKGGVCLTEAFTKRCDYYDFRCASGHTWRAQGQSVLLGGWCGQCANASNRVKLLRRDGLERLQQAAATRGGMCLSEHYCGVRRRHRFRCAQGHEWESTAKRILAGNWCGRCVRRLPDGLLALQRAAAAQGGACLADTYEGVDHRYRFRCAKGHEWMSPADPILRADRWCMVCAHESLRLGIQKARDAAHARGGQCLSEAYVNNHTKLSWLCHKGHVWQAPLASVRNKGCWCPQCAHADRIATRQSKARVRYAPSQKHGPELANPFYQHPERRDCDPARTPDRQAGDSST